MSIAYCLFFIFSVSDVLILKITFQTFNEKSHNCVFSKKQTFNSKNLCPKFQFINKARIILGYLNGVEKGLSILVRSISTNWSLNVPFFSTCNFMRGTLGVSSVSPPSSLTTMGDFGAQIFIVHPFSISCLSWAIASWETTRRST